MYALSVRARIFVIFVFAAFVYFSLSQRLTFQTQHPKVEYFHLKTSHSRLLPYEYWNHRSIHPEAYDSETCTRLPQENDIEYAAPQWQHKKIVNGSIYLYGAYWDNRFVEPLVRVLVYVDVIPLPELLCQLWYSHEASPHVVKAEVTYAWRKEWGGPTFGVNEPYIVTCRATFHHHHPHEFKAPPLAVSLVQAPCEKANNVLNVQDNQVTKDSNEKNKDEIPIAACLKWLDYGDDVSAELIEWLLLLKYFGTEMVYVYVIRAHPNVHRVLNKYSNEGFVQVTELSHPPWLTTAGEVPGGKPKWGSGQRNFHDYRRELLPLNDCLYRSLGLYDWLAVFDMDELIVPVKDLTYPQLISRELAANKFDALVCRNVYFLDGAQQDLAAPKYAKMLSHEWRAKEPSDYGLHVKSFHKTSTVVAMHNHTPMSCGNRNCNVRYANHSDARLHHYRSKCDGSASSPECQSLLKDTVRDTSLRKYRSKLLKEIPIILNQLGIPLPE